MASEGEGILIPVEARDEMSGALKEMAGMADLFMSSMEKLNGVLNKTGNESDRAQVKAGWFMQTLKGIKSVGDSLSSFKIKDLFGEIENMSLAGVAIGASMIKGTRDAMNMEQQLARVGLSSKVTADELKDLKKEVFDLALHSTTTANEISVVSGRLLKEGEDVKSAGVIMKAMSKLVSTFGGDYVQSFKEISSVTKAFGQDTKSIPDTLDLVAKVASETNTEYTELLGALQSTAPFAKGVGLDMKELINIYGTFKSAGLDSSQAIRALRTSMMSATRANISYKDAMTVVGNAYKSTNDETARATLLQQTFGRMGLSLAPIFAKLGGDYAAMTTKFKDSTGALDKASEVMDSNAKDRLEALYNRIAASHQIVGDKYLPSVSTTFKILQQIPPEIMVAGTAFVHAAAAGFKFVSVGASILKQWPDIIKFLTGAWTLITGMATTTTAISGGFLAVASTVAAWTAIAGTVGLITYSATKWLMTLEKTSAVVHGILETIRMISGITALDKIAGMSSEWQGRVGSSRNINYQGAMAAGMPGQSAAAMARVVRSSYDVGANERLKETIRQVTESGMHIEKADFTFHGVQNVDSFERELSKQLTKYKRTHSPAKTPK